MGVALGVDGIIVPHAKRRRAFTAGNTTWEGVGPDTLWDMAAVRRYAAGALQGPRLCDLFANRRIAPWYCAANQCHAVGALRKCSRADRALHMSPVCLHACTAQQFVTTPR